MSIYIQSGLKHWISIFAYNYTVQMLKQTLFNAMIRMKVRVQKGN